MSQPYRPPPPDARAVLDLAREAMVILDAERRILCANRAFHESFGTTPTDTGRLLFEVGQGDWNADAVRSLLDGLSEARPDVEEYLWDQVFPGVGRRVLMLNARRLGGPGDDGRVVVAALDVTARQQVQEALQESEQRFHSFFDNAAVGMVQADVDTGRFVRVNHALCTITGYSREELLCLTIHGLTHPDDREANRNAFCVAMTRESPQYQVEKRIIRKDGEVIWVRVHVGVVKGEPGVPRRTAAVVENITARKFAEDALHELNASLEERVSKRSHQLALINEALMAEIRERHRAEHARTELLKRLASTQEEERRRLARELHDHSGQLLTALSLGLKQLEEAPPDGPSRHERLRRLRDLVDQLGREVHTLALELRPTALDDVGLADALASYAETWSRRARIEVDFHSEGLYQRLPGEFETTLYRVVQEALTNVLKHSGARRVSLILEQRDGHVVAIVEDDGRGFRPARLKRSPDARQRLGLLGMEERLEAFGGSLEIESTPGKGTTVFARVPYPVPRETSP